MIRFLKYLKGTFRQDVIEGSDYNDHISGYGDDDVLWGKLGRDKLLGGRGKDALLGGTGDDTLLGGDGNDLLIGSDDALTNAYRESYTPQTPPTPESDNDLLIGGKGDDRLFGGKGRDVLKGGADCDTLFGGDGSDRLFGGAAADRLYGGKGNDILIGNSGDDSLHGGAGHDTLRYVLRQNSGSVDDYSGNRGVDTLQLEFTAAEWARTDIQQEVLAFARFMAAHTDSVTGQADNAALKFTSFGLTARGFEKVKVKVDGALTPILKAVDDQYTVQEDATPVILGSVLDNDFGAERVELVSGPAEGILTLDPVTGEITFDTSTAFTGLGAGEVREVSFDYRIFAADGTAKDATATIYVEGIDDLPDAQNDSYEALEVGTLEVSAANGLLANDAPSDGGDLRIAPVILRTKLGATVAIDAEGGFSYDPSTSTSIDALTSGEALPDSFTYTVIEKDGDTSTATATIDVQNVDDLPVASDDSFTADEDNVLTVAAENSVLLNDRSDNNERAIGAQPFTGFSVLGAKVVMNEDGTFTYDPTEVAALDALDAGESLLDSFDYILFETDGDITTATVQITVNGVNDAPTASDDSYEVDEDTVLVVGAANGLLANDTPAQVGDTLTTVPMSGTTTLGGAVAVNTSGAFSYDATGIAGIDELAQGESLTDSFSYVVKDQDGDEDTATATITFHGVNDAPTLAVGTLAANEDGPSVTLDLATLGDDVDSDDTGSSLAYTVSTNPTEGTASISGTTLTFAAGSAFQDLALGETRNVKVGVTATDAHGATAISTVNVTVTGTNDAPTLAVGTLAATEDGPSVTLDLTTLGDDVDSDDTGSSLTYTVSTNPTEGTASISGNTLTFAAGSAFQDLAQGETHNVTVGVTATDAHGATAISTVNVTVTGTNDAPTLEVGTLAATEDGPSVTLDLASLGDDVDSDNTGSSLTYTVSTNPTEGTASISGNTLTFAAGADFQDLAQGETRNVTVGVTATDAHGATAISTVNVTINGTNDAPEVSAIDAGTVTEDDTTRTINLLAGQSDADNGAVLTAVNISAVDQNGAAVAFTDNGDGSISVDPSQFDALDAGESRTVTVSYDVSDGIDSTANTATLVVNGITDNQPPVAQDDDFLDASGLTNEGTAYTFTAAQLLGNDSDPEGANLSIEAVSATSSLGATVILNGNGTVTYNPATSATLDAMDGSETLEDSFTYTVSDGTYVSPAATVSLTVSGVNDPPILTGTTEAQSGFTDEAFSYQLPADLFTDHDEGGAITYAVTLANGSALPSFMSFDATTRTLSYAANAPSISDVGLYSLRVTATEPDGQSNTTTLTLTVLDGDLIEGTPSNDNLTGTIQGDLIRSLGQNDTIRGLTGSDVLDGGVGNDQIYGDAGNDVLIGGDGNDRLYGEEGDDNLYGGDGNDVLEQREGSGVLDGGSGNDTIYAGTNYSLTIQNETLLGGEGDDVIWYAGRYSNDSVDAGAGNDQVVLYQGGGYSGNEITSTVTLGAGADVLEIFSNSSVSAYNQVTVTDFNVAEDQVLFNNFLNDRLSGWDGASNPFGAGFLRLIDDGLGNTLFEVDTNGGGDNYVTMITFKGVAASAFSDTNFDDAWPPNGSAPTGQTLTGTEANETLEGGIGGDTINGLGGNDSLFGNAGSDVLDGGVGNDWIYGDAGNDLLIGGDGNDWLYGEDGDDTLYGGDGNDRLAQSDGSGVLDGGSGNDAINAGVGYSSTIQNETLLGGEGDDVIWYVGSYSNDSVDAGAGNDQVVLYQSGGYSGNEITSTVTLGAGADVLEIFSTSSVTAYNQVTVTDFNVAEDQVLFNDFLNNRLSGWDGASNPFGTGFLRLIDDGSGNSLFEVDVDGGGDNYVTMITFKGVAASTFLDTNFDNPWPPNGSAPAGKALTGTEAAETLEGGVGGDTINGLGGNDTLYGNAGADVLDGGVGNDWIYGDAGDDVLIGGDGNDRLYGEEGDDNLYGGDGNDVLDQADGSGVLDGGIGNDTIYASQFYSPGHEDETLLGGDGDDRILYVGRYSNDSVDAGAGNDQVVLYQGGGSSGNALASTIALGAGADVLEIYSNSSVSAHNRITITDFNLAEDQVLFKDFLNERLSGWDGASNPFGAGFLRLIDDGLGNTLFEVDLNGGGDNYVTMITFKGVAASAFSDTNFLIDIPSLEGYDPSGAGIFGTTTSGTASGEVINGSIGDDTLQGLGGDDTLNGGNGNDRLEGGADNDDLTGGFGADSFVFGAGAGNDVIQDFEVGVDVLVLTDGLTITGLSTVDTDGVGGVDSTLVELSDASSITFMDVLDLSGSGTLL